MTTDQRLDDIDRRLERLTTISEQVVNRFQGIDARTESIFLALDQLRQRQEASQNQLDQLRQRQEASQNQLDQIRDEQHNLSGLVDALIQAIDRNSTEAATDRAFVRGLQVENHRIWEYLQEQRRGDAGSN